MKKLSITTLAILTILAVLASVGVQAAFNEINQANPPAFDAFSTLRMENFRNNFGFDGDVATLQYDARVTNPANGLDCPGANNPNGCPTVDRNTGTLTWTPLRDSVGADSNPNDAGRDNLFHVSVRATDANGVVSDPVEFDVEVRSKLSINDQTFAANLRTDGVSNNGEYEQTFTVQYSSPNNLADLRFSVRDLGNNQQIGAVAHVEGTNFKFTWIPRQADKGVHNLILEGDEGARVGGRAEATPKPFSVTVEGAVLSVGTAQIGDGNTKRSNPQSSIIADHNRTGSAAISISNSGDLPVHVGDVTITIAPEQDAQPRAGESYVDVVLKGFRDAQEEARVEALTLNPGASDAINVKANIVSNLPAVDPVSLIAKAFKIGTVSVLNEETNQPVVTDLKMQAENKLEIDDVEVCKGLEGAEKCEKPSNGDTVDEVKPFESLSVAVTVENKYQDEDEDPAIEDVVVEIASAAADLDVNDDNEETDIDVDSAETFSDATIDIEDDADGTSKVKVTASGRDENGALHGATQEFSVKIERTSHEIDIAAARLNPALASCTPGNRNVQVDVELRNIGKKKEKDVKVEARVDRSGFNVLKTESDIEMDKDDEHRSLLTFAVPEMIPPGVYPVEVKSFTDRNQLSDTETVMLTVPDCGFLPPTTPEEEVKEDEEKKEDVVVTTPSAGTATAGTTGTVATATPVAKKATKTFTASNAYIGALGAIIVVLLIVGGILVAMIVRKQ